MDLKQHWNDVYRNEAGDKHGWYRPQLETSLAWIRELVTDRAAAIVDVGCGTSTLVDDLLDDGYRWISVLDVSATALEITRQRLAERANDVTWMCCDVTTADLPLDHFDLWHDRAVFHFMTSRNDVRRYRDIAMRALRSGGHLIIGTFAPEAPPQCSGLPVQRYDVESLRRVLGGAFTLERHEEEFHVTPGGIEQRYHYCLFQRS